MCWIRSRSRSRTSSNNGTVTPSHHCSVWISSIRTACCAIAGMPVWSSKAEAISRSCLRNVSNRFDPLSSASSSENIRRSNRLASSVPSIWLDGSGAISSISSDRLSSSIELHSPGARYFSTARRCWRTMKLSVFNPPTMSCSVFAADARMSASLGGASSPA
jgi:hypothetical protein